MLAGAVVALGLGLGAQLDRGNGDGDGDRAAQPSRAAVDAYRARVEPILDRGGTVVAYGMRPGIEDIAGRALADSALASMADDWRNALLRVRDDFAAVEPDRAFEDVHWLYARALDAYVQTSEALRAAVDAEDDAARKRLIDLAASLGDSADELFDRAESGLDALT